MRDKTLWLEFVPLLYYGPKVEMTARTTRDGTRLCLGLDYAILAQIYDLTEFGRPAPTVETHPLPPNYELEVYGRAVREMTRTDSFGKPLRFAYARDLAKVMIPPDSTGFFEKAIFAMIKELPGDIPIVLYVHD